MKVVKAPPVRPVSVTQTVMVAAPAVVFMMFRLLRKIGAFTLPASELSTVLMMNGPDIVVVEPYVTPAPAAPLAT
jgi:hypothetical protein